MCAKKFDTLFDPFFSYLAHFSSRFAMLAVATHQYLCNVHRPVESSTTKFQTHTRPIIWLNHRQHVRTHTLTIIHTHRRKQIDMQAEKHSIFFRLYADTFSLRTPLIWLNFAYAVSCAGLKLHK